jgi:hypothetical protein
VSSLDFLASWQHQTFNLGRLKVKVISRPNIVWHPLGSLLSSMRE